MRALLAAWLLLLAGCASAPPQQPGWRDIAPGLRYWHGDPGLHVLQVDLRLRRLQLTPHTERGRTLLEFDGAARALAVVNGSFFDSSFRVRGHTVSGGEAWPEPMSIDASPLLACEARHRCVLDVEAPYELPGGMHTALSGTPWLIRSGQARTPADDAGCAYLCERTHPRTALGLSADGHTLWLLLVEGRREGVPGLTLAETAARLQNLGAHDALNLDGGGSSSLLVQGVSVMQRPANEPALRRVANALLIW